MSVDRFRLERRIPCGISCCAGWLGGSRRVDGSPMNAYERERAECAAEEEARADRRLAAWRRLQMSKAA